ncbi:hypothetical protein OsI_30562 [Oryza sativa Indica Group]|uniref:Bidirectional sugar transporter SWEET n=1 Tax=Oryza sativa subsp. indica TaxID=39946 RepID=B8BDE6_ORYSI|nr:hypothetical protein OsI_30562 [Oryza sativa Indica Group]
MVSPDMIRNVVGIVGNVISFGLFLSPVPTFWRIIKNKNVQDFKADPYLATLLNCMLWVFYGLRIVHPNSILVVTINGIGLVIETCLSHHLLPLLRQEEQEEDGSGAHTHQRRSLIVSILCVIFDTIMYSSPLTVMSQVVKTKSVEYMPLLLSVVSFLNGLNWTSYALICFDIFITIPNGLGVLFAAVQLILYVIYYRTTPKKQNKNLELPTVTPVTKDTSVAPISKDNDVNGSTASHVTIDITIQP